MKPADFSRSKVTEVSSYTCYTLQIILNNRVCVCLCVHSKSALTEYQQHEQQQHLLLWEKPLVRNHSGVRCTAGIGARQKVS